MSNVYVSEPATSGKVIFETTHGPLEIQLWCRECPLTTRFFVQLCLDGYYDNMLFHRIVPSFLIQTGAMRQNETTNGSDASATSMTIMKEYRQAVRADYALERRKLELHSRLRFNHRGQVSMALPVDDSDDGDAQDLQPQFFITLEESRNLDAKYVLFGTVAGPTYFNAARIGNLDADPETNQPVDMEHAPRVLSVKIVDNPIHQDIVPQQRVPWRVPKVDKPKKKKRKGKFDKNVLSFGDEVDDADLPPTGIKRGHEAEEEKVGLTERAVMCKEDGSRQPEEDKAKIHQLSDPVSITERSVLDKDNYRKESNSLSGLHASSSIDEQTLPSKPRVAVDFPPKEPKQESRSILEIRNAKYRQSKSSKKDREGDTLAKLFAFKSKVKGQVAGTASTDHEDNSLAARMARRAQADATSDGAEGTTYHGQVLESDDEEQEQKNKDWLKTTFKCRRHMDHSAGGDGRNMNEYEIVDPHRGEVDRNRDESAKNDRHERRHTSDRHRDERKASHRQKKHKSHHDR